MTDVSVPVGPASGGSGRSRYLVGSSNPDLLTRVIAELRDDPRVSLDRILESAGVGGAVIETTPDEVDRLRAEYGPELIIEPDQELGLF